MARTYSSEFPDFVLDVIVPSDFKDSSWHNDAMPSFSTDTLKLWINYRDPAQREIGDFRFALTRINDEGEQIEDVLATDDWSEMIREIAKQTPEIPRYGMDEPQPTAANLRWMDQPAHDMAYDALNAACALIQERLGVDDGGFASMFFDDGEVYGQLVRYIEAERSRTAIMRIPEFRPHETGGGCQALIREYADGGYCLITEQQEADIPETMDTPCALGFYNADGIETAFFNFPTVRLAVEVASAREYHKP